MSTDPRQAAAVAAMLLPDSIAVGKFTARKFSGGDMLAAQSLGLVIAGDDIERIKSLPLADKTRELLTIGALLCQPRAVVQSVVFAGGKLPETFVADVLFDLTGEETSVLLAWVCQFFTKAKAVEVALEPKPTEAGEKDQPEGK